MLYHVSVQGGKYISSCTTEAKLLFVFFCWSTINETTGKSWSIIKKQREFLVKIGKFKPIPAISELMKRHNISGSSGRFLHYGIKHLDIFKSGKSYDELEHDHGISRNMASHCIGILRKCGYLN